MSKVIFIGGCLDLKCKDIPEPVARRICVQFDKPLGMADKVLAKAGVVVQPPKRGEHFYRLAERRLDGQKLLFYVWVMLETWNAKQQMLAVIKDLRDGKMFFPDERLVNGLTGGKQLA